MNQQELQQFLEKAASGDYNNEEYQAFTHWMDNCSREEYKQMLICWERVIDGHKVFDSLDSGLIEKIEIGLDRIDEQVPVHNSRIYPDVERLRSLWPRITAAASILLFISVGVYFFSQKKRLIKQTVQNQTHDITPGGNKAILTLANGSKIVLNEALRGVIARQQNVAINQIQNGKIVYSAKGAPIDSLLVYNTIATPRGGQYQVVLPDGTKVWLNAASSLKYPTAFYGNERRVELTGEAYFEVSKNAAKPFFVKTAAQTVEVLGTHFNINSYADEKATKTTLLEGSVKVYSSANQLSVKLVPGQQALNILNQLQVIRDADVDEAVAWKNGKFMFRNTDLQTIMRQLSRWYDVDVEYQGNVTARHYIGSINRNVPVSQVFQILKTSGINFTIYGRKIIVKS